MKPQTCQTALASPFSAGQRAYFGNFPSQAIFTHTSANYSLVKMRAAFVVIAAAGKCAFVAPPPHRVPQLALALLSGIA